MRTRTRIAIILIATMLPALAQAECLTLRQAKKEWPGTYLSWRGKHCWFSPKYEKRAKRHRHVIKEERRKPAKLAKSAIVLQETEIPSSPAPPVQSMPAPKPVLTAEALVQHYIDTSLSTRINDAETRVEQVRVILPASPPVLAQTEEQSTWRILLVGFLVALLTIATLYVAGLLSLIEDRWFRKREI